MFFLIFITLQIHVIDFEHYEQRQIELLLYTHTYHDFHHISIYAHYILHDCIYVYEHEQRRRKIFRNLGKMP